MRKREATQDRDRQIKDRVAILLREAVALAKEVGLRVQSPIE